MRRNGMESTTRILPAAVYCRLRERSAVAWCEFGRDYHVVAALSAVPCGSRAELEHTLRQVLHGVHVAPQLWRATARGRREHATLGHAPRLPAAMGWLGYEAGSWFERMPSPVAARSLPDAWWGLVTEYALFDHEDQLLGMSSRLCDETFVPSSPSVPPRTGARRAPAAGASYQSGVRTILKHLRAGDCYQVNLARQVVVDTPGDPLHAWLRLRTTNPARRAMLIETPYGAIVSNSPELLLSVRGTALLSVPIKGTSPLAEPSGRLLRSPKERAELTMIVDLVRSDLGRVATPGSVRAGPRRVGRVGHVHHAMQRVYATLAEGKDAVDALAAIFPPGSVTGAPKVRAMEIIRNLERVPRGVYCGALGWVGSEALELNVAIRTITFAHGVATIPVGAGIVIGSDPEREFAETELKAARMLEALC